VAISAANRLAGQAVGVVAVDGSCFAEGDPEAVRAGVLETIAAAGFGPTLEGLFTPMFTDASPADLRERAMTRALAMDAQLGPGLIADMAAWDAAHSAAMLGAVRVPLLAIQSTAVDADRRRTVLGPGEGSPWTDAVAARVPGARVELLPGVGHFTMNEAPRQVNTLIADFVAGLTPPEDRAVHPRAGRRP
jgi:pimeloyl-ACP methyl ester carboxylesterase